MANRSVFPLPGKRVNRTSPSISQGVSRERLVPKTCLENNVDKEGCQMVHPEPHLGDPETL